MNTPVNIATLHASIKAALAAQFPAAVVDYYPRPGDKITTPAIFIELDDIQAANPADIGTDQTPVTLRFNAYCVDSYRTGKKLAVRTMAAAVLHFVNSHRWGCPVGAGNAVAATPDRFQGDTQEYEVMRVEWEHEALLGIDSWIDDGDPPDEVNVSEQGNAQATIYPEQ